MFYRIAREHIAFMYARIHENSRARRYSFHTKNCLKSHQPFPDFDDLKYRKIINKMT